MAHQLVPDAQGRGNHGGQVVVVAPPAPRPFEIPMDPRLINPQTEKVQMRVSRIRGNGFHPIDRLICQAEGQPGFFPSKILFVAERERLGGGRGFRIFDVSQEDSIAQRYLSFDFDKDHKKDPRFAGEVHRSVNTLGGLVEYKLVRENPLTKVRTLVGTTIYAKKTLRFRVNDGTADRIVYSVVHDNSVIDSENSTEKDEDPTERMDASSSSDGSSTVQPIPDKSIDDKLPHFTSLNKPVIKHVQDDIHQIGEDHPELQVFQNKRRFTNWRGTNVHRDVQSFYQKYRGRAMRPSKKNLQIMRVSSGATILQVGRLDDNTFALDFLPPYTPFQALGIFLAQLDAN